MRFHPGSYGTFEADRDRRKQEQIRNAAPELLQACKTALSYLESFNDIWQEGEEMLSRQLEKAIAKAEGGQ